MYIKSDITVLSRNEMQRFYKLLKYESEEEKEANGVPEAVGIVRVLKVYYIEVCIDAFYFNVIGVLLWASALDIESFSFVCFLFICTFILQ